MDHKKILLKNAQFLFAYWHGFEIWNFWKKGNFRRIEKYEIILIEDVEMDYLIQYAVRLHWKLPKC